MILNLGAIKASWNEVLDALERTDRVAWLAYFDGRLVSFENGTLILDFSDPNKFKGGHDFSRVRMERFRPALELILKEKFEVAISVKEIS